MSTCRKMSLANIVGLSILILSFTQGSTCQSQPMPCMRWAHQTAVSGSNLWIQGGNVRTSPSQQSGTWTNALLSLDLSRSWSAGSPTISLVKPDSGNPAEPPAVALAALWPTLDHKTIYLYGGEYSDNPYVPPGQSNLWSYDIPSFTWSAVSDASNQASVLGAAEGASVWLPDAGTNGQPLGFYGFGHVDSNTDPSYAKLTRVYLSSLLEYDLGSNSWRNLTDFSHITGSLANSGSGNSTVQGTPTYRADFTLTYVPGLGTDRKGILVSIGGGNDAQTIDNSALDVFDIGAGGWTRQATQGDILPPRVNPCTVRGSATVNGVTKHQLFVYGGQNANMTVQYNDVYILDIPSYQWTYVGSNLPSAPTGRAGHSCDLYGSQMIVIGGYVSDALLCDSQPVYIFDTSTTTWSTTYVSNTTYSTPPIVANVTGGMGTNGGTSSSPNDGGSVNGSSGSGTGTAGSGGKSSDGSGGKAADPTNGSGGSSNPSGGNIHGSSTKFNLGAIIGGTVGGMILAFGILVSAAYLIRRHRKKAYLQAHRRLLSDAASEISSAGTMSDGEGLMYASRPYETYLERPPYFVDSSGSTGMTRKRESDRSQYSNPYSNSHSANSRLSTEEASGPLLSNNRSSMMNESDEGRQGYWPADFEPPDLGGDVEPSFFGSTHLTPKRQLRVANV